MILKIKHIFRCAYIASFYEKHLYTVLRESKMAATVCKKIIFMLIADIWWYLFFRLSFFSNLRISKNLSENFLYLFFLWWIFKLLFESLNGTAKQNKWHFLIAIVVEIFLLNIHKTSQTVITLQVIWGIHYYFLLEVMNVARCDDTYF